MNISLIRERLDLLKGRIECRWSAIPARKQRTLVLYLFSAYVAVTIIMIAATMYRHGNLQNGEIQHIRNPIPLQEKSRRAPAANHSDTLKI